VTADGAAVGGAPVGGPAVDAGTGASPGTVDFSRPPP
jgi:hypothetical protein